VQYGDRSEPHERRKTKALSRKQRVHDLFDKNGAEAAWTLGIKLKLNRFNLLTWFSIWRTDNSGKD
jgi:hypothetical protein